MILEFIINSPIPKRVEALPVINPISINAPVNGRGSVLSPAIFSPSFVSAIPAIARPGVVVVVTFFGFVVVVTAGTVVVVVTIDVVVTVGTVVVVTTGTVVVGDVDVVVGAVVVVVGSGHFT